MPVDADQVDRHGSPRCGRGRESDAGRRQAEINEKQSGDKPRVADQFHIGAHHPLQPGRAAGARTRVGHAHHHAKTVEMAVRPSVQATPTSSRGHWLSTARKSNVIRIT